MNIENHSVLLITVEQKHFSLLGYSCRSDFNCRIPCWRIC